MIARWSAGVPREFGISDQGSVFLGVRTETQDPAGGLPSLPVGTLYWDFHDSHTRLLQCTGMYCEHNTLGAVFGVCKCVYLRFCLVTRLFVSQYCLGGNCVPHMHFLC